MIECTITGYAQSIKNQYVNCNGAASYAEAALGLYRLDATTVWHPTTPDNIESLSLSLDVGSFEIGTIVNLYLE